MSNEEKYMDKTLKLPRFSGKQEDWQIWSERFLIRAKRKGYKDLLTEKVKIPTDSETSTDARIADELDELRELNELAFEEIEMGMDTDKKTGRVAFDYVRLSKTNDNTEGNCKLAWDRLKMKFESKQAPTRLMLRKEFYNKKLNSIDEDPDEWITELEDLRLRMQAAGSSISDMDLIEHILNNLPSEYNIVVKVMENRLNVADDLSIMEVRNELCLEFAKHKFGNTDIKEDSALYAGGFKGTCNKCGKMGHKARFCKSGDNSNKDKDWKKKIECYNCHKKGHFAKECRSPKSNTTERASKSTDKKKRKKKKKSRRDEESDSESSDSEMSLVIRDVSLIAKESDDIWIGDSGASGHMVNTDKNLFECKKINEEIVIANDETIRATKIGKLKVEVDSKEGKKTLILDQVRYVPGLGKYNLLSITKAISKGYNLSNEKNVIILKKNKSEIRFDTIMKTRTGHVVGTKLRQINPEKAMTSVTSDGKKKVDVNEFHKKIGHLSQKTMEKVAALHKIKLTGSFQVCRACAEAKARQKNLGKKTDVSNDKSPGGFLWMDVSSVSEKSYGGSKYWLLIVDDATNFSWSHFLKEKSEVGDALMKTLEVLDENNNEVTVRCDNAGENYSAQTLCKEKGKKVKFEFTSPETPQQNGKVERKFATLWGRVRAMMNSAGVKDVRRKKLWAECANHATFLENISLKAREYIKAPWWDYSKESKWIHQLPIFGEIGVVKTAKEIQSKMKNKGDAMMFIGIAKDHATDCFKFLNLKTNKVVKSRNVRWLKKTEPELLEEERVIEEKKKPENYITIEEVTEDEEKEQENVHVISDDETSVSEGSNQTNEEEEETIQIETEKKKEKTKIRRALLDIADSLNPEAQREVERLRKEQQDRLIDEQLKWIEGNSIHKEFGMCVMEKAEATKVKSSEHILDRLEKLVSNVYKIPEKERQSEIKRIIHEMKKDKPETFEQAYYHPDLKIRLRWRIAIKKEFRDMNSRKVWETFKKSNIPKDRRCIKCKWVFDIKRDGRFRARLVACGYSQVPGVDFVESYAPVINDITWRILIVLKIMFGFDALIVDVETAFLHGDLEETIFMECPPGMKAKKDECCLLRKSIYGLVQAARQYFKKYVDVLRKAGFEGGDVDPCLMYRKTGKDIVYISIHVDDALLVGTKKGIQDAVADIKKGGFELKIEGSLDDYLSCEITFDEDGSGGYIHQPHLISRIEKTFGDLVKKRQEYGTPGTPGFRTIRNPDEEKLDEKRHSMYRSGVGMLLYLVKHSRPDLANPIRELSKVLDGPSEKSWGEMCRIIKYVLDTRNMSLRIKPKGSDINEMEMIAFSDSDWAADRETRISVSGFIIYLNGVAISWKSRAQKGVTLSSSEAEFVALSEAVKEIRFIFQVLRSMGIKVKTPIVVRADNVGAMFMAKNTSISDRTKHVDIRYHFIREFVDQEFIKIVFVSTKENVADIFTKNLPKELFDRHSNNMIEEKMGRRI